MSGALDDHLIEPNSDQDTSDLTRGAQHDSKKICVGNMHSHIKNSSKDQVNLVPPAPIPVQAGPGDHPLASPTLVPGAEVEDVLPLLKDQDGKEVICLMKVVSNGCTGGIKQKVVADCDKILSGDHSVSC
eukprot:GFUD01030625.1.p2 GENE.GFUD01030625.1~~GFUD01030625.1.p2  ORF type:complete len:130 (-),score=27.21 GFUD01030625.1:179-568(-)